mgnify:FL=1
MRVIGGKFKGKRLIEPKDKETRPLKDLTKESIFNIINHSNKFSIDLKKAQVLDLFSGVGSFGIECLSRNAKYVTFVENYKGVLPVLKKNLDNLKLVNKFKIVENDIFKISDFKKVGNKFDIIFCDPPYKEKKLTTILNSIINQKILNKGGIIIIHRHKKEKEQFPDSLNVVEEKNYGISKIIFSNIN